MWNESLQHINSHFVAYSENMRLTVLGPRAPGSDSIVLVDIASCKMSGLIALAATHGHTIKQARRSKSWTPARESEMAFSKELVKSCWALYKASPSGLAPAQSKIKVLRDSSPAMSEPSLSTDMEWIALYSTKNLQNDITASSNHIHNGQHAYIAESLFYLWRITEVSKS